MGTIIEFPIDASARRSGSTMVPSPGHRATVVILPVVRIERHAPSQDDSGPEQGAPPRRRRRRVRS
ncbi:hypothetical protein LPW26_00990 [Rhodopseudomonas sp. HC1]|uniref:hypothetical protein n=1 Tax=Rhodopseudomonas infernalis TaxID=2897386 RepID=UPI001EE7E801|nr:hypothetical protein [Rhodopseudomonas infernalis]MCG6203198.1 hypothetical protein [Rhodopseudomonas infernalis]